MFILGRSTPAEHVKLVEEQSVHGDLLQLDVPEGWNQLVLKSLAFLNWAASRRTFRFLGKADGDSFWNLTSILRGLESLGNPDDLSNISTIFGNLFHRLYAPGWGQYKIPGSFCCPKDIFPDYTSGGAYINYSILDVLSFYFFNDSTAIAKGAGYILTRAAVDRLVPIFECVPHYYIEDAWITGFLAGRICLFLTLIHYQSAVVRTSLNT